VACWSEERQNLSGERKDGVEAVLVTLFIVLEQRGDSQSGRRDGGGRWTLIVPVSLGEEMMSGAPVIGRGAEEAMAKLGVRKAKRRQRMAWRHGDRRTKTPWAGLVWAGNDGPKGCCGLLLSGENEKGKRKDWAAWLSWAEKRLGRWRKIKRFHNFLFSRLEFENMV
jgi:hypothetical protein